MRKTVFIVIVAAAVLLLTAVFLLAGLKTDTAEIRAGLLSESEKSIESFFSSESLHIVSELATPDFLDFESSSWISENRPEFVMLHFCSAVMTDAENPYDMKLVRQIFDEYDIGTHYIIDRNGKISCYIPEERDAWHAGKGEYANDERYTNNMNRYAIGIELVAIGSESDMSDVMTANEYHKLNKSIVGFTDEQYDSVKELVEDICTRNEISHDREHIIGHEDYNKQKSDPGELFEWERIFN